MSYLAEGLLTIYDIFHIFSLISSYDIHCIFTGNLVPMHCVIERSISYSFHLFPELSVVLCFLSSLNICVSSTPSSRLCACRALFESVIHIMSGYKRNKPFQTLVTLIGTHILYQKTEKDFNRRNSYA